MHPLSLQNGLNDGDHTNNEEECPACNRRGSHARTIRSKRFSMYIPAAAYTGQEGSVADIRELISGFPAIAKVCGLDYLDPIWLNGVSYAARDDAEAVARQQAQAREYAARLIVRIREVRD